MTIEKLPSGKYRIREVQNGKRVSVTVPFKPTKKDAFFIMQDKLNHKTADITFREACEKYTEIKSHVLSQSTIRGYKAIMRNLPADFMDKDLSEMDNITVQAMINDHSANHAPKTTINVNGFVVGVLKFFNPDISLHIQLPKKQKKQAYFPTVDDVRMLLDYSKGSDYYVPIFLASLSLRLSEICALGISDIDFDTNALTINKALIYTVNREWVIKPTPKTDASNRTIIIPAELANAIQEQGYVFNHRPASINRYLNRTLPKLGIPYFSIHFMRHFFCAYASHLGYSEQVIQNAGGWATPYVMKTVYRYAMQEDEAKQAMAHDFSF